MNGQQHAPAALYPGKDTVPIAQEAGWAPGPVWTGGKSSPPVFDPGRWYKWWAKYTSLQGLTLCRLMRISRQFERSLRADLPWKWRQGYPLTKRRRDYSQNYTVPLLWEALISPTVKIVWVGWVNFEWAVESIYRVDKEDDGGTKRTLLKAVASNWRPKHNRCNRPNLKVGNTSSTQGILRVAVTGNFSFYQLDNNKDICGLESLVLLTQSLQFLYFTIHNQSTRVRHC